MLQGAERHEVECFHGTLTSMFWRRIKGLMKGAADRSALSCIEIDFF